MEVFTQVSNGITKNIFAALLVVLEDAQKSCKVPNVHCMRLLLNFHKNIDLKRSRFAVLLRVLTVLSYFDLFPMIYNCTCMFTLSHNQNYRSKQ